MSRKEVGIGEISLVLAFGKIAAKVTENSTEFELQKSPQNVNHHEQMASTTDKRSFPSADEIFNQIKESFGEGIAKSFRGKKLFWRQINRPTQR